MTPTTTARTAPAPTRSACKPPAKPPSRAPILVTHFNTGSAPYVFTERCDDLAKMRKAFNAVIVKAGDQQLVEDARAAGLSVYVEMDRKSDFARGKDISADVQEIVRQVKAHPGTIAGIRVADRLNGGGLDPYDPGWLKPLGAGLGAAAVAVVARVLLSEGAAGELAGMVALGASYLGLLAVLGVEADDRAVLRQLLQRARGRAAAGGKPLAATAAPGAGDQG